MDCEQRDVQGFGISGDSRATALEAGVCVETVREGGQGRLFMASAWMKEEEDAARHRQEKRRANETREKVVMVQGNAEPAKRHYLTYIMWVRHMVPL